MISKIALGTVQFGLDYGINNKTGKVPFQEVKDILTFCNKKGIHLLDTAVAYGDSEEVIGRAIEEIGMTFDIVTKLPQIDNESIAHIVKNSCATLNTNPIYGFLFHSYAEYQKSPTLFNELITLKKDGLIKKIGFSLYHPEEALDLLAHNIIPDIVQVPYSVFDRRFEQVFDILKTHSVEVHTRSTFLQGLFFKDIENLSKHFLSVKDKLIEVKKILSDKKIPLAAGLLNFALLNESIDKVVIGVDSLDNLKENLSCNEYLKDTQEIYTDLQKNEVTNLNIILPTNWKNVK